MTRWIQKRVTTGRSVKAKRGGWSASGERDSSTIVRSKLPAKFTDNHYRVETPLTRQQRATVSIQLPRFALLGFLTRRPFSAPAPIISNMVSLLVHCFTGLGQSDMSIPWTLGEINWVCLSEVSLRFGSVLKKLTAKKIADQFKGIMLICWSPRRPNQTSAGRC
jgi:hypothetical protein